MHSTFQQSPLPTDAVAGVSAPHDCVRRLPTVSTTTTRLCAYDWSGAARMVVEVEATGDLPDLAAWIMDRVRAEYPPPVAPPTLTVIRCGEIVG